MSGHQRDSTTWIRPALPDERIVELVSRIAATYPAFARQFAGD